MTEVSENVQVSHSSLPGELALGDPFCWCLYGKEANVSFLFSWNMTFGAVSGNRKYQEKMAFWK